MHVTQCGTSHSNTEVILSAQHDIPSSLCPLMECLPDLYATVASNIAQCNLVVSISHHFLHSICKNFLLNSQNQAGTIVFSSFWLCALPLHCYQRRVHDYFFTMNMPTPCI
ncbi:hypothetical protein BDR07DRAFT_1392179 [Suillus spraguei]|nr:hypothetical protein BDR07DRAFT_1392179 [Suillus spraguei]